MLGVFQRVGNEEKLVRNNTTDIYLVLTKIEV